MTALSVAATGPAADAVAAHVPQLVADQVASRLFAKDPTLWGPAAEAESAKRLVLGRPPPDLAAPRRRGRRAARRARRDGLDRVVLCGMGGSSLAPEVICATAGVQLVVLDSSDPDVVRAALADLDRTVVVVSSKSRLHRRDRQPAAGLRAAPSRDAGIDPTDAHRHRHRPRQPARRERPRGRLPRRQRRPRRRRPLLRADRVRAGAERPGRRRHRGAARRRRGGRRPARRRRRRQPGAAPGRRDGRHRARCATSSSSSTTAPGTSASPTGPSSSSPSRTGKDGTGILPVVEADRRRPRGQAAGPTTSPWSGWSRRADDEPVSDDTDVVAVDPHPLRVAVGGSLGAQMLLWEAATAVAGRLLGINPFDQPDVESAKAAARELLDAGLGAGRGPAFTDGAVEVRALGDGDWLGDATTVGGAVDALLAQLDPNQATSRSWPTSTGWPTPPSRPRVGPRDCARSARRRSAGGRASCTRPGSTTRAGRRPASTCRSPTTPQRGPRHPRPGLHLRRLHRGPGRRRRRGARRPRPPRAAAAPDRPRRRTGPAREGARRGRFRGLCGSRSRRRMSPARVAAGTNPLRDPRDKRLPRIAGPVRHGALRGHRRPRPQEADAGDLRPRQPRPAAAGLLARRVRPPRLGRRGLRQDRLRVRA